jgi:hypothetical protein
MTTDKMTKMKWLKPSTHHNGKKRNRAVSGQPGRNDHRRRLGGISDEW